MGNTPYAVHVTRMADRDIAETTNYLLSRFEFQAAKDSLTLSNARWSRWNNTLSERIPHMNCKSIPTRPSGKPVFGHRSFTVCWNGRICAVVPHGKRSIEDELIKRALRFGPLESEQGDPR
ncbi:MAG: hypothetical protein ACLU6O_04930 [Bilophila wadsworthia]